LRILILPEVRIADDKTGMGIGKRHNRQFNCRV
jgi:hypothetical protein